MYKNLVFTFLFVLTAAVIASGQISTPAASPSAKYQQTVGLTDVMIEYSRPGVKGRTIFGDLVPYDQVWRTGANQATKITFDKDVQIEGTDLKSGSYAILSIPGMKSWNVHFYDYDSGSWNSYIEKEPVAVVTVQSRQSAGEKVENFLITIEDLHAAGGEIQIAWDDLIVPLKLAVHTDKEVMASIEKAMAGPSGGDYYNAGSYLHESGKDLNKALMYVQKVTKTDNPRFWQLRRESLILADLGRKAEAITVAKKSLEMAKEAGNNDYVKLNMDSIKEWSM